MHTGTFFEEHIFSVGFRVTKCVCEKNRPKRSPTRFSSKLIHNFYLCKKCPESLGNFCDFPKKCPKDNSRPIGENSLNLVTLVGWLAEFLFLAVNEFILIWELLSSVPNRKKGAIKKGPWHRNLWNHRNLCQAPSGPQLEGDRGPFLASPLWANLDPQGRSCPPRVNFFPQGWIFSPGDEIICSALEYKLAPRAKLHPWGQTILLKTGHRVPRQYINSFFSTGIMAQASLHLQPDYSLFTEILCCTTQVLCMYLVR
jgi:hypothetical protein